MSSLAAQGQEDAACESHAKPGVHSRFANRKSRAGKQPKLARKQIWQGIIAVLAETSQRLGLNRLTDKRSEDPADIVSERWGNH